MLGINVFAALVMAVVVLVICSSTGEDWSTMAGPIPIEEPSTAPSPSESSSSPLSSVASGAASSPAPASRNYILLYN